MREPGEEEPDDEERVTYDGRQKLLQNKMCAMSCSGFSTGIPRTLPRSFANLRAYTRS